jgi:N-acetyl-gamma-glutamyl-phosphate reductase
MKCPDIPGNKDERRMVSVFIDGEAGTTGLGIRDRLADLPVDVRSIAPERRKDSAARQALMREVDFLILCLPDEAAREAVALADALGDHAPRILDASSAHRTAPGWQYGFPEFLGGQAARIAAAPRVSNPGCYATGAIALLRPLVDAGLIPPDHPIPINAISGYSGGGRQMIEAHERTGGPAFELYALGLDHKHLPEIEFYGGLKRRPIFVPSVGHFAQGMLVSIPLHLDTLPLKPTSAEMRACLAAHYAGAARVMVKDAENTRIEPEALNGRDALELYVYANEETRQAVLVARLDNLGKGASGAAIQNLRLMLGLGAETKNA